MAAALFNTEVDQCTVLVFIFCVTIPDSLPFFKKHSQPSIARNPIKARKREPPAVRETAVCVSSLRLQRNLKGGLDVFSPSARSSLGNDSAREIKKKKGKERPGLSSLK